MINVLHESLLSESFPSLGVTVPSPPWDALQRSADLWACWGRAAQILIWSYASVFLLPMSMAIRTSAFSLWDLSMTFYILHGHRVCLVDRVDLIRSLYSWWESFGSSSLAILPLGSNCGFISTFASGSYTGVCS